MKKTTFRLGRFRPNAEFLEPRFLLARVDFVTHELFQPHVNSPESVIAADLDNDGDNDVLFASDDKIAWYENSDGSGTFGELRVIYNFEAHAGSLLATAVFAADMNNDGHLDVLSVIDGVVTWHKNADGKGTFERKAIRIGIASFAVPSDVDGDGDVDVLSASIQGDIVALHENIDGKGTFGEQHVISTGVVEPGWLYTSDMDFDGDADLISSSWDNCSVTFLENTDEKGTFADRAVVRPPRQGHPCFSSVYAADMDGDGDLDALPTEFGGNVVAWYENTDGKGTDGGQRIIDPNASGLRTVYAADVDGDGDVDVLAGQEYGTAWYENIDGKGSFSETRWVSSWDDSYGVRSVVAADLDGDHDLDVLVASGGDDKIAWYENTDGEGTFGTQQPITSGTRRASQVYAVDLDGDSDLDILSDKIAWHENVDGAGSFGELQSITSRPNRFDSESVYPADVDGDGDMDVFSAMEDGILWYENRDGEFVEQIVIAANRQVGGVVHAADVDGDGDTDVVGATAWYENTDGLGTFGEPRRFVRHGPPPTSVFTADLDGDADLDVLAAYWWSAMAWCENTDGAGTFGERHVIPGRAPRIHAADVDGDGDLDVITASNQGGTIAWQENTDGKGTFEGPKLIDHADIPLSVYPADIDNDGDIDVLSATYGANMIAWYENTDGNGKFGSKRIITVDAEGAESVFAADVDGDGDLDVLSAGDDRINWYENLLYKSRLVGDVDDDGIVAFADFLLLAANFGRTDAAWEDGDFDGDQTVTFADFLILSSNFGQSRPRPVPDAVEQAPR